MHVMLSREYDAPARTFTLTNTHKVSNGLFSTMKNASNNGADITEHVIKTADVLGILLKSNADDIFYVKQVIYYFYFKYYLTHYDISDESVKALQRNEKSFFLSLSEKVKIISASVLYILKNDILSYNGIILNKEYIILENYEKENYVLCNYLATVERQKGKNFIDFLKVKIKDEQLLLFMTVLCCSTEDKKENLSIFWTITAYIVYTFLQKYGIKKEKELLLNDLYDLVSERFRLDGYLMCINKVINVVISFYISLLNLGKDELLQVSPRSSTICTEQRDNLHSVRHMDGKVIPYDDTSMCEELRKLFKTVCTGLLLILENLPCVNYITFVILDIFIVVSKYNPCFIKKNIEKTKGKKPFIFNTKNGRDNNVGTLTNEGYVLENLYNTHGSDRHGECFNVEDYNQMKNHFGEGDFYREECVVDDNNFVECWTLLNDFAEGVGTCIHITRDRKKCIDIVINNFKKVKRRNKYFMKYYFVNVILPFKKFFYDEYVKKRLFYMYTFVMKKVKYEDVREYLFIEMVCTNYIILKILYGIKKCTYIFIRYLKLNEPKIYVTLFNNSLFIPKSEKDTFIDISHGKKANEREKNIVKRYRQSVTRFFLIRIINSLFDEFRENIIGETIYEVVKDERDRICIRSNHRASQIHPFLLILVKSCVLRGNCANEQHDGINSVDGYPCNISVNDFFAHFVLQKNSYTFNCLLSKSSIRPHKETAFYKKCLSHFKANIEDIIKKKNERVELSWGGTGKGEILSCDAAEEGETLNRGAAGGRENVLFNELTCLINVSTRTKTGETDLVEQREECNQGKNGLVVDQVDENGEWECSEWERSNRGQLSQPLQLPLLRSRPLRNAEFDAHNIILLFAGYYLTLNCLKYKSMNKKETFLMLAKAFDVYVSTFKKNNSLKKHKRMLKNSEYFLNFMFIIDTYQTIIINRLVPIMYNDKNSSNIFDVFISSRERVQECKKNYLDKFISKCLQNFYVNNVNIYEHWKKLTVYKSIVLSNNFFFFNTCVIFSIYDNILSELVQNFVYKMNKMKIQYHRRKQKNNFHNDNDNFVKIVENFIYICYINNILTFVSVYSKDNSYVYSLFGFYKKMEFFLNEMEKIACYEKGNDQRGYYNTMFPIRKQYTQKRIPDWHLKDSDYDGEKENNSMEYVYYWLISHLPFCLMDIEQIVQLYIEFLNCNYTYVVNYVEGNKTVLTLICTCVYFEEGKGKDSNKGYKDKLVNTSSNMTLCNIYFFKSIIYVYMQSCIFVNNPRHIHNLLKTFTSINNHILSPNVKSYLLSVYFLKRHQFRFCKTFAQCALRGLGYIGRGRSNNHSGEENGRAMGYNKHTDDRQSGAANNQRDGATDNGRGRTAHSPGFLYDLSTHDDLISVYFMNIAFCNDKRKLPALVENMKKSIYSYDHLVGKRNDFLDMVINFHEYNTSVGSAWEAMKGSLAKMDIGMQKRGIDSENDFARDALRGHSLYGEIVNKDPLFIIKEANKSDGHFSYHKDRGVDGANFFLSKMSSYLRENSIYCYEFYRRCKTFDAYANCSNPIDVEVKRSKRICRCRNKSDSSFIHTRHFLRKRMIELDMGEVCFFTSGKDYTRKKKDMIAFYIIYNLLGRREEGEKGCSFLPLYLTLKNDINFKRYIERYKIFFSLSNVFLSRRSMEDHTKKWFVDEDLINDEGRNRLLFRSLFVKHSYIVNGLLNNVDINCSVMLENYMEFLCQSVNDGKGQCLTMEREGDKQFFQIFDRKRSVYTVLNAGRYNHSEGWTFSNFDHDNLNHLFHECMQEEMFIINEIRRGEINGKYAQWSDSCKGNLFMLKLFYDLYEEGCKEGRVHPERDDEEGKKEHMDITQLMFLKRVRRIIIKFSYCKQKMYDYNYVRSVLYDQTKKVNEIYVGVILNHLLFLQYVKTFFLYNSVKGSIKSFGILSNQTITRQSGNHGSILVRNDLKVKNKILNFFKILFLFYHEKELLKRKILSHVEADRRKCQNQCGDEETILKRGQEWAWKGVEMFSHAKTRDDPMIPACDGLTCKEGDLYEKSLRTNFDVHIYDFITKVPIHMYATVHRNILSYLFEINDASNVKGIVFFLFLHLYKKIPEVVSVDLTAFYKTCLYNRESKIAKRWLFGENYKEERNGEYPNGANSTVLLPRTSLFRDFFSEETTLDAQDKVNSMFSSRYHCNSGGEKGEKFFDESSHQRNCFPRDDISLDGFSSSTHTYQLLNRVKDANFQMCLYFNDSVTNLLNSTELVFYRIFDTLLSYAKYLRDLYKKGKIDHFNRLKMKKTVNEENKNGNVQDGLPNYDKETTYELDTIWGNHFISFLVIINEFLAHLKGEIQEKDISLNNFLLHIHFMTDNVNTPIRNGIEFGMKKMIEEEMKKVYVVFIDFYCYLHVHKRIKLVDEMDNILRKHLSLKGEKKDVPKIREVHLEELVKFLFDMTNLVNKVIRNNSTVDIKRGFFETNTQHKFHSVEASQLLRVHVEEKKSPYLVSYNSVTTFGNYTHTVHVNRNYAKMFNLIFSDGTVNSYMLTYGQDLRVDKYVSNLFDLIHYAMQEGKPCVSNLSVHSRGKNSITSRSKFWEDMEPHTTSKVTLHAHIDSSLPFGNSSTAYSPDAICLSNMVGIIKKSESTIPVLSLLLCEEEKKKFRDIFNEKFKRKVREYLHGKADSWGEKKSLHSYHSTYDGKIEETNFGDHGENERRITPVEIKKLLREIFEDQKDEYEKCAQSIKLYIHMLSNSSRDYFENRKKYTLSLVINSCIHFLIKTGNRYLCNYVYDYINHDIVNITLNETFQKGLYKNPPELVPLRITSIFWNPTIFNFTNSHFVYTLNEISSLLFNHRYTYISDFCQFLFSPFYNYKKKVLFDMFSSFSCFLKGTLPNQYTDTHKEYLIHLPSKFLKLITSIVSSFNSVYLHHIFIINQMNRWRNHLLSHHATLDFSQFGTSERVKRKADLLINSRIYFLHLKRIALYANARVRGEFYKICRHIGRGDVEGHIFMVGEREVLPSQESKKEVNRKVVREKSVGEKMADTVQRSCQFCVNGNSRGTLVSSEEEEQSEFYWKIHVKTLLKETPLYCFLKLNKLLRSKEVNYEYLLKVEMWVKRMFIHYCRAKMVHRQGKKKSPTVKEYIDECLRIIYSYDDCNDSSDNITCFKLILCDNFMLILNAVQEKKRKVYSYYAYFISFLFYVFSIDLKWIIKVYILCKEKKNNLKFYLKNRFFFPIIKRSYLKRIIIHTTSYISKFKNKYFNIFYHFPYGSLKCKENAAVSSAYDYSKNRKDDKLNEECYGEATNPIERIPIHLVKQYLSSITQSVNKIRRRYYTVKRKYGNILNKIMIYAFTFLFMYIKRSEMTSEQKENIFYTHYNNLKIMDPSLYERLANSSTDENVFTYYISFKVIYTLKYIQYFLLNNCYSRFLTLLLLLERFTLRRQKRVCITTKGRRKHCCSDEGAWKLTVKLKCKTVYAIGKAKVRSKRAKREERWCRHLQRVTLRRGVKCSRLKIHSRSNGNVLKYIHFLMYLLSKNWLKKNIMRKINGLCKHLTWLFITNEENNERKKKIDIVKSYNKIVDLYKFYDINIYNKENVTEDIYKEKELFFYKPYYASKRFLFEENELDLSSGSAYDSEDHNTRREISKFRKGVMRRRGNGLYGKGAYGGEVGDSYFLTGRSNNATPLFWGKSRTKNRARKLAAFDEFQNIRKLHLDIKSEKEMYNELNMIYYMSHFQNSTDVHYFNDKNFYNDNECTDALLSAKYLMSSVYYVQKGLKWEKTKGKCTHFLREKNLFQRVFHVSTSPDYLYKMSPSWAPWL
ncbi:hypothetical protein POVCU2_0040800 [Plasmodium ovale curtisi]|uniref:PI3K/PI4K catalytic domain-containing protein n=1 Tax=Plasmodium ovale curtisi TaxID=864141 RepID=A0A1A8W5Y3_PLAOA|nr:hypothetical protein POVCU2_0040800 [Plasmodium ovale curtisi]SBS97373.1 hypothetical protein POVCU1_037680 [Plasmodium ovale curtisi]